MKKNKSTTALFMVDALTFTLGAVIILMTIFMIEISNSNVGIMWFEIEVFFNTTIKVDNAYEPSGVSGAQLKRKADLSETDEVLLCREDQNYEQCKADMINDIEAFSFSPFIQNDSKGDEKSHLEASAFLLINNPIDTHIIQFIQLKPIEQKKIKKICVMTAQLDTHKCYKFDSNKMIKMTLNPSGEFSFNQSSEIILDNGLINESS